MPCEEYRCGRHDLHRHWGGTFENVTILVAIAVNEDGYREVLGAAEGMKGDKARWVSFFQWLRSRDLNGMKLASNMLKAIHAQESKQAAREKAKLVAVELKEMKLQEAARKAEIDMEEPLTYFEFPSGHWTRIRTNHVIERLNREIRRRTKVADVFLDGNSALMLVCARLHMLPALSGAERST